MRFCLLAERQVGIGSAAAALEQYARARPGVAWTDVTYFEAGGLLERLRLPSRVAGTLRGYLQSGAALRQGPYDALFFLTHNPAVLHQGSVGRTPSLLWTDVTPALLDAQAAQYEHAVDRSKLLKRVKHGLVRRTFQRAALCVGWSEWARRSFVADYGVAEAKTHVVAPGIDLSRWTVGTRTAPDEKPRLLFVGGNFVRKGGDLLLDVYREHFRGRCSLDIVTRDPVSEEAGVRVHHGLSATSPALLELYRNATAFVLPTRGDCFSIASIEAMATGLPVVVSAVGGISDIVDEGRSGYLLEPDDGPALRMALDALVSDPARALAMGRRGRALAEERFDAEKSAARLFELLEEIGRAKAV